MKLITEIGSTQGTKMKQYTFVQSQAIHLLDLMDDIAHAWMTEQRKYMNDDARCAERRLSHAKSIISAKDLIQKIKHDCSLTSCGGSPVMGLVLSDDETDVLVSMIGLHLRDQSEVIEQEGISPDSKYYLEQMDRMVKLLKALSAPNL